MACYNGERWLKAAIDSIVSQRFDSFEVIIVDDGSEDRSAEIAEAFAKRDSRLIVLRRPHMGLARSLNFGISHARGEWIARLDSDDLCEVERLSMQLLYAQSDPNLVFIASDCDLIDENGSRIGMYTYPHDHSSLLRNLLAARKFPPHSSAFFRKDAFVRAGQYRGRFVRAQDTDLWLRLSEFGKFGCVKRRLVRVRVHPDQLSKGQSGETQMLYGIAARVCHWLRQHGGKDPAAFEGASFKGFVSFVADNVGVRELNGGLEDLKSIKRAFQKNSWKKISLQILACRNILRFGMCRNLFLLLVVPAVYFGRIGRSWLREHPGGENCLD